MKRQESCTNRVAIFCDINDPLSNNRVIPKHLFIFIDEKLFSNYVKFYLWSYHFLYFLLHLVINFKKVLLRRQISGSVKNFGMKEKGFVNHF